MKDNLRDLNRINRIIKTLALVNSTDDFCQQPQVVNGFSELMGEVFGEAMELELEVQLLPIHCLAILPLRSS